MLGAVEDNTAIGAGRRAGSMASRRARLLALQGGQDEGLAGGGARQDVGAMGRILADNAQGGGEGNKGGQKAPAEFLGDNGEVER